MTSNLSVVYMKLLDTKAASSVFQPLLQRLLQLPCSSSVFSAPLLIA